MPPLISRDLMEHTWQSFAQMEAHELQERQALCGEEQEELTGFVNTYLTELAPDAAGLGLYIHLVLMEAFRRTNTAFGTIESDAIMDAWEDNGAFADMLKDAGYGRQPFTVQPDRHAEPAALQYVFDALTEEDEDDPVDFEDDDFWSAIRVLKTVIDCMHEAQQSR